MSHFYILHLFKDPLRNTFTHSYSFIFVTFNYHSGHFPACAYSHSIPLSFFLLRGVWHSLFQAPLAVPSTGRSKTGSYPSNNKRGNNTVGEHSISLLLHFIQVSAQGLSDAFEQMDVKMKDKLQRNKFLFLRKLG